MVRLQTFCCGRLFSSYCCSHCLLLFPLFVVLLCSVPVLLCSTLCVLQPSRGVAVLLLSTENPVAVIVLYLFLAVPWVGLQCVIVAFSDYTHFFTDNQLTDTTSGRHDQSPTHRQCLWKRNSFQAQYNFIKIR